MSFKDVFSAYQKENKTISNLMRGFSRYTPQQVPVVVLAYFSGLI